LFYENSKSEMYSNKKNQLWPMARIRENRTQGTIKFISWTYYR